MLKEVGILSSKKRRLRGDTKAVFIRLKAAIKKEENVFSFATEARYEAMSSNYMRADLDEISGNIFLTVKLEQWNKLPREVLGSLSLEVFKNRVDRHLIQIAVESMNKSSIWGEGTGTDGGGAVNGLEGMLESVWIK